MYTYRLILDAYNSRDLHARPATVVTYAQGWNRAAALARIHAIYIAQNGAVSDGINPWPGARNLPAGPVTPRSLPEWTVVSMRSVSRPGRARILAE